MSTKRKLTRAERQQIAAAIARAKQQTGDKKHISAQETISYQRMWPDGICRVTDTRYTRTIRYQDINYQLNQDEDKDSIFRAWCDFLNYFDSSIHVQLSFLNLSTTKDTYAESVSIPAQNDAFNYLRTEYTTMLQNQLAKGNNGLVKTKYLTFGIDADSIRAAKPRLERIETDILNNFKELISDRTVEKVVKLMRCAYNQAVRWEIVSRNPFNGAIITRPEYQKRDIWTADMIRTALDVCRDNKLYVAMNLAFACSMRMGEILGLQWSNVHISDEDIERDDAHVYIDKELQRASNTAIEMLGGKDVFYIFEPTIPTAATRLILKKPKTESSVRKVWLPPTLAHILQEWKKSQENMKTFLGDEYQDYDLVVTLPNGRPCEDRIILNAFYKLREEAGLPRVVFHSLRHSSTTYKLKLNHGDLKATQGDTGHAEIDMITKIYAHILDEDRKINAQRFENAFYSQPELRLIPSAQTGRSEKTIEAIDPATIIKQLADSPEMINALASLIVAQAFARKDC